MSNFAALKPEILRLAATDLSGAIKKCGDYLEFEEDAEALELLRDLQAKKAEQTALIIETALNKAEPLWEQKLYDKLYSLLMKLDSLDQGNKKVEAQIVHLRNLAGEAKEAAAAHFNADALSSLKEMWRQGDFAKVIEISREILELDPANNEAADYEAKAGEKLIGAEIAKIEGRFGSRQAFKEEIAALKNLAEIHGWNRQIEKAMLEADAAMMAEIKAKQDVSIKEGLARIGEFLATNDLSGARLVLQELEKINAMDAKVVGAGKKIERLFEKQRDDEVVDLLKKNLPLLDEEFSKNRGDYLTI